MNLPIVIAGFDPTVNPGVPTNSQLLQMVQAAHVATGIGVIYWGQSAPNLVTYPDADTALWGKLNGSNVPTGEFFYWNVTWLPFTITALDGSKITNGTITAAKLSTAGATAGDILYFNGTSWTLAAIVASIGDNTLPIAKIVKPGSGSGQVLYYNGSTLQWYNLTGADIINLLTNKSIPVAKLAVGGSRYVLRTKADLSIVEYAAPSSLFNDYELSPLVINTDTEALSIAVGVVNLDVEAGNGGPAFYLLLSANVTDFNVTNLQSGREVTVLIAQDGTGGRTVVWDSAIEWLDGISPVVQSAASAQTVVKFINLNNTIYGRLHAANDSDIKESSLIAISTLTTGTPYTSFTHGLGARPRLCEWSLRCNHSGGDAGYAQFDTVPIHRVYDNALNPVFTGWCNATTIGVTRTTNAGAFSGTINIPHKTTGAFNTAITSNKWDLVCNYSL
jgi:hypothetical protein